TTGSNGEYLFRTVKPGLYPGRTRHIHYQITALGRSRFTTQLYVQGEPLNGNDGVLNEIRDTTQRNSVIVPWTAVSGSRIGELAAKFDIVLGFTATDTTPARPTMISMVHGASFQPGAASSSWATIFGDGLSSTTRAWNASELVNGKLPESLDGVSVRINNKPASVYYISPKQIDLQAPDDTTSGQVQVTVTNAGGTSDPMSVELQSLLPGFFLLPQDYVAAVRPDGTYVGPAGLIDGVTTTPAQPSEIVSLFGTGFGPATPNTPAGQVVSAPAPLSNPVKIQIDTVLIEVKYAGLTGAGLYQFNIEIPDLPDGDHPVTAQVGAARTRRIGRIRIQRLTSGAAMTPGSRRHSTSSSDLLAAGIDRRIGESYTSSPSSGPSPLLTRRSLASPRSSTR
ncbi:MAG: hypothetical protein HY013_08060, partial [Candidatus Solibacter usitatus]|nr:hypothetical protein [Candidatus Solibacter usitatus]